ncbi:transcriptional initiation protein Tat [Halopelagius fulvigenes]|uniref:Transcriptional initiation protein Tat n=1 Tax=Halopelagius fulvigenes TaxID=1198324 RepID=A0ABD5TYF3_9EURY
MESRPPTRRNVLQVLAVGLSAGCLGSAPGATGPRRPPTAPEGQPRTTPTRPDLYVKTFDFGANDDGTLRVFGEVGNRGTAERIARVRVRVTVDGETRTRETNVTVPPESSASFEVDFEVTESEFLDGGGIDVSVV